MPHVIHKGDRFRVVNMHACADSYYQQFIGYTAVCTDIGNRILSCRFDDPGMQQVWEMASIYGCGGGFYNDEVEYVGKAE